MSAESAENRSLIRVNKVWPMRDNPECECSRKSSRYIALQDPLDFSISPRPHSRIKIPLHSGFGLVPLVTIPHPPSSYSHEPHNRFTPKTIASIAALIRPPTTPRRYSAIPHHSDDCGFRLDRSLRSLSISPQTQPLAHLPTFATPSRLRGFQKPSRYFSEVQTRSRL